MPISTFLHDREPERLRGLDFMALAERGWTLAGTVVSDGGGGGTVTFVAGGTVPCRIDPLASARDEQVIGGRLDARSTHKVTVPAGTQLDTSWRFEIENRDRYEITAIRDRTDQRTITFEVVAS